MAEFLYSHPYHRLIVTAFSVGLNAKGEPTAPNQAVINRACSIYLGFRSSQLFFCAGHNQPAPRSGAAAMASFARQHYARIPPKDIFMDGVSLDTPESAEQAVRHLIQLPMGGLTVIALVCHPLHLRRSRLCLKRALRREVRMLKIQNSTVEVFAIPAEYPTSQPGLRLYENTPGQPQLSSHNQYLFYEILATVVFVSGLQNLASWTLKASTARQRRHKGIRP